MWPRTRLYRRRYGAAGSPTLSIPVRGRTASRPSEAWVVTPRRIQVVPACRVMHNVRAPGGAGQTSEMTRPAIPTTMRTTPTVDRLIPLTDVVTANFG
jgi:hypothetical protein